MRILFFGDIFGRPGRSAVQSVAPKLQEKYNPDISIANVENIAHGNGVTRKTLSEIEELGIFDAYTSGDHIWDRSEADEVLEDKKLALLRPFNTSSKGEGSMVVSQGARRILVVNILGHIFSLDDFGRATIKMRITNPFLAMEEILKSYTINPEEEEKELVDGIFVDMHAEFTGEKRALGFHLDGRVSAVVGTHTHVPTNDAQILPQGTAYISDVGMTGPFNSVTGLDPNSIIRERLENDKKSKDVASDKRAEVGAVVVDLDKNGLSTSIQPIREIVEIV